MPSPCISGGGHDTFLLQITCKKPESGLFSDWIGWFSLFRLAKMPPSVSCCWFQSALLLVAYTAISRKVVAKSARDNPERYCGWFWIHCCPKKFKKRIREATDVCLRELKESNKSRFDSYSVRNSVLIISHITFRDCRVHIFSDNLSRNSCKWAVNTHASSLCVMKFLSAQFSWIWRMSK